MHGKWKLKCRELGRSGKQMKNWLGKHQRTGCPQGQWRTFPQGNRLLDNPSSQVTFNWKQWTGHRSATTCQLVTVSNIQINQITTYKQKKQLSSSMRSFFPLQNPPGTAADFAGSRPRAARPQRGFGTATGADVLRGRGSSECQPTPFAGEDDLFATACFLHLYNFGKKILLWSWVLLQGSLTITVEQAPLCADHCQGLKSKWLSTLSAKNLTKFRCNKILWCQETDFPQTSHDFPLWQQFWGENWSYGEGGRLTASNADPTGLCLGPKSKSHGNNWRETHGS